MVRMNVTVDPELEVIVTVEFIEAQRMAATESLLLFGLYALLASVYLAVLYCLWRGGLRSNLSKVHLGAVTVMFVLTTVYIVSDALYLRGSFDALLDPTGSTKFAQTANVVNNIAYAAFSTTVTIGDAIILWRAAMLCAWPRWVMFTCAIVILFQGVAWILGKHYSFWIAAQAVTLTTSLAATIAVTALAWHHRTMLRSKIAMVSRRSAFESIVTILTETGIVYTILWGVYIPSQLPSAEHTTYSVVMSDIMTIFAPLYPMTIVIVVALHRSELEDSKLTSIEPITVADAERMEFLPQETVVDIVRPEFNPYDMIRK
ncbi:unnamed protein product [Peniophora sp. CBMAI 1063]|nr:unnamed protein product [Peniophora sp. CBMAI 1063]